MYTDGECSTEFEIKAASTAKKDTTDKENKIFASTGGKKFFTVNLLIEEELIFTVLFDII